AGPTQNVAYFLGEHQGELIHAESVQMHLVAEKLGFFQRIEKMFVDERDVWLRRQIADRAVRIVARLVGTYPAAARKAQEHQTRRRATIVLVNLAEPILQVTAVTPGFRRKRIQHATLQALQSRRVGIRRRRD